MAFGATDVVAPMLAAAEVVMFLAPGVTSEACFRYVFLGLVFERNDLRGIGFLDVRTTGAMT